MAEPRIGCGAAIIVDGRILLLLRLNEPEAGCWGLPGGKVELYETAAAATVREVAEELAITIAASDLLCLAEHIEPAGGLHWVAPIYLVTSYDGSPRIVEPDKHGALRWFALDDLPAKVTVPTHAALAAWRHRASAPTR